MNEEKKNSKMQSLVTKAYFKQGLAFFLVGLALIVCFYYINHFEVIANAWAKINRILLPFYLGIIMAYLLCPVYNASVKFFYRKVKPTTKTPRTALKVARVIGTVLSLLVIFIVIIGLIIMIIPNL
ncbi:MAG: AI-2E family transporter, partial [Firmicutes bacterium]|nr:AI-2E family transporter [Bacillota bacterium]